MDIHDIMKFKVVLIDLVFWLQFLHISYNLVLVLFNLILGIELADEMRIWLYRFWRIIILRFDIVGFVEFITILFNIGFDLFFVEIRLFNIFRFVLVRLYDSVLISCPNHLIIWLNNLLIQVYKLKNVK